MKPIDLQGWEIEALRTGATTAICRPVSKQPDDVIQYREYVEECQSWVIYGSEEWVTCPFRVGDELWVREIWAHDCPHCDDPNCGNRDHIWYKADELAVVADSFSGQAKWRPSICMPRFASRYKLTLTGIRLLKVNETRGWRLGYFGVAYFAYQWNKANRWRGNWYRYENNPWVWVYEGLKVEVGWWIGGKWSNESV